MKGDRKLGKGGLVTKGTEVSHSLVLSFWETPEEHRCHHGLLGAAAGKRPCELYRQTEF